MEPVFLFSVYFFTLIVRFFSSFFFGPRLNRQESSASFGQVALSLPRVKTEKARYVAEQEVASVGLARVGLASVGLVPSCIACSTARELVSSFSAVLSDGPRSVFFLGSHVI